MAKCPYCSWPKPDHPLGCCIVGEAFDAFEVWRSDPRGEMDIQEQAEAYCAANTPAPARERE